MIEDHSLVRDGISRLIATSPKHQVAGAAASLEESIDQLHELRPDVVTLDLELPGLSGRDAVRHLKAACPWARVVVVSARLDPPEVQSLFELGVMGYVTKGADSAELLAALDAVSRGENYLSRAAAAALATAVRHRTEAPVNPLSDRLLEVLRLISRGKTTQEIAEELILSPRTVEKYRGEILRRLECRNQIESLHKARELGLLE